MDPLSRAGFFLQLFQKRFHKSMSVFRNLPGGFRIHFILQEQELFIKVPDRRLHRPAVLSAVGKGPRDSDRSDRVEPVRVPDDFPLDRGRSFPRFRLKETELTAAQIFSVFSGSTPCSARNALAFSLSAV